MHGDPFEHAEMQVVAIVPLPILLLIFRKLKLSNQALFLFVSLQPSICSVV
jgi:hypothetical protein